MSALFAGPVPPAVPGVDLRLCDVATMCADESIRADLVHADPPWTYRHQPAAGKNVAEKYDVLTMDDIARHVNAAYDRAAPNARLILWCTAPKIREWFMAEARIGIRWRYVTGGSWVKTGKLGIGFHWRGDAEPPLIYVKGAPGRPRRAISSGYHSTRGEHSEKPVPFLRSMLRAWSPDGGTVMDLYAGLSPLARACVAEGRQYVGAEIDPQRRADALALLARAHPAHAAAHSHSGDNLNNPGPSGLGCAPNPVAVDLPRVAVGGGDLGSVGGAA